MEPAARSSKKVLVIDDDRDVAELVQTILIDEGFKVSCLYDPSANAFKGAIETLEPDVVLLDGGRSSAAYGPSWEIATWLVTRPRPIPTVMLTAHSADRDEAVIGTSLRAMEARFAGVIPKPFDIDRLVAIVWNAIGQAAKPISDAQEAENAARLLERLRAAGATDLDGSKTGRVWATFRAGPEGSLYKVYRWRAADVYFVGRYAPDGHQMEPLGQFADEDALIEYCVVRIGDDKAK